MKSYIAFGDYNDTLEAPDKGITLYGADNTATTAASPYVTASPVSTLAVRASDNDTTDHYLFGDGATIDTAATVQSEAGTGVTDRYTYTNIGGINDNGAYQNKSSYDASSVASKFNSKQQPSHNGFPCFGDLWQRQHDGQELSKHRHERRLLRRLQIE